MDDEIFDGPYEDDSDDILEHYGILGQKWGVRRYQNEDGSRTQEGKRHREEIEDGGGSSTKSRLKKVAIVGGVALASVAVGYALHKSGAARAGFNAISEIFGNGAGKTTIDAARQLPSKTASNATDAVYKANKAAKAARESGATKTVAEAARTVKTATSVKGTGSVAETVSKSSGRTWTKQAKRFKNVVSRVAKASSKTKTNSSVLNEQASKYSNFASDLINKMK